MVQKAGIIITDGNKFLAEVPFGFDLQRGSLDIPKGHLEEGEDPLEGALREVMEETSLDLSNSKSLTKIDSIYVNDIIFHWWVVFIDDSSKIDLDKLKCPSQWYNEDLNVWFPEVAYYVWLDWDNLDWLQYDLKHCASIIRKKLPSVIRA